MIQRLRLIMFAAVALAALLGAFTPGALSLTFAQPERPLALEPRVEGHFLGPVQREEALLDAHPRP